AVNKLFKLIIAEAINKKASDIHIEPFENYVRIRYRIDGILQVPKGLDRLPVQLKNQLTTKFKLAAGMNIAEKRVPQDGRIRVELKDRVIDFRVSCLPVIHGEKIVLRMLDKSNLQLELEKLGFEDREYNLITKAIRQPYGMILVTGPTGSGKTTTLYSCLMKVNSPQVNITTAEDPVEYSIEGINQVQINPQVGLTFAEALRAFLRQDPDIILVGEIRDKETAEIGIESALTGHLVLSTLHTNDSVAAITRLEDMGIEKFLISSSVILVVAQRLARKICPKCKKPYQYPEEALKEVGFSEKEIPYLKTYKGKGCDYCNGTGYKGRVALYEVFEITPEIKDMIVRGKSEEEIRKKAVENGLRTLREIGKIKIAKGVTTPEEVLRVTR
ncbi:GspE/PulE family protein, partial [Desulfurobacterium sp.]|uniref:GspE/PulE family protein n=1 Tax=Desulfurobacterium sp. TaxID=2004706 RepID=UPI00261CD203